MRRRTVVRAFKTAAWVLALVFAVPALAADYIYSYNEADQLKTGRRSDSLYSTSFTYDGDGIRLKTTQLTPSGVISSETIYVYDAFGNVIAEYDSAGQLLADYVWVNGQRICKIAAGEQRTYYHAGPGGSVLALSNAAGQIIGRSDYQPFGSVNASSGTTDKYAFLGKDSAFGLYYLGARWYDPATGRFAAPDPVAGRLDTPETLNRYAYALNNPNKFHDPDGELFDTLLDIGFIGYDAYRIVADNVVGQKGNFKENMLALGADVGGAAIPFVTGAGMALRAAARANDAVRAVDRTIDGVRILSGAVKVERGIAHGHHALPKFLGGVSKQILAKLNASVHGEFHSLLSKNLKAHGLPLPSGGVSGSAERWAEYFVNNPGGQQQAFDAVFETSVAIDQKYGTKVFDVVMENLAKGNFTVHP